MRKVVREPFPDPMVRDAMSFGRAVRAARTAAGITLEAAAEALSISKATMSDLEGGKGTVALGTALRVARDLGVAFFTTPLAAHYEAADALQHLRLTDPSPWGGPSAERGVALPGRVPGDAK
jgi:transcriptional regulator with XRE-family HTH domain